MTVPAVTSFLFGGLVLAGGVLGFIKAGSRPSLIAGIVSDALLVLAGVLMFLQIRAGWFLSMAVAALLLVFFASRWWKGRKFMPAGMMVLASAAALALLAWSGR